MRCDLARETDDAEVRRLLRDNPFDGDIRLTLEREPNSFLAADVEGDVHQIGVVREIPGGPALGVGNRAILDAWVNGEPARLGYLSQLRVDGRRVGACVLRAGFAGIREMHADGAVPYYVSMIVEDNARARRVLEAGLSGLPAFRLRERFVTVAIPLHRERGRSRRRRQSPRRPRRRGSRLPRDPGAAPLELERGRAETVPEIADCLERFGRRHQFAPRWDEARLRSPRRCRGLHPEDFVLVRRERRVVGCVARWDQRAFKQSVVRGYSRRLGLGRPLLNLASPWLRVPRLPAPGERIESAFLSHLAVDDDDPGLLFALLEAAHDDAIGTDLDYLVLGLAERHPLLEPVRRAFPGREYTSLLYLVHWEDGTDAVARVDDRVPHLEVAIL